METPPIDRGGQSPDVRLVEARYADHFDDPDAAENGVEAAPDTGADAEDDRNQGGDVTPLANLEPGRAIIEVEVVSEFNPLEWLQGQGELVDTSSAVVQFVAKDKTDPAPEVEEGGRYRIRNAKVETDWDSVLQVAITNAADISRLATSEEGQDQLADQDLAADRSWRRPRGRPGRSGEGEEASRRYEEAPNKGVGRYNAPWPLHRPDRRRCREGSRGVRAGEARRNDNRDGGRLRPGGKVGKAVCATRFSVKNQDVVMSSGRSENPSGRKSLSKAKMESTSRSSAITAVV